MRRKNKCLVNKVLEHSKKSEVNILGGSKLRGIKMSDFWANRGLFVGLKVKPFNERVV